MGTDSYHMLTLTIIFQFIAFSEIAILMITSHDLSKIYLFETHKNYPIVTFLFEFILR